MRKFNVVVLFLSVVLSAQAQQLSVRDLVSSCNKLSWSPVGDLLKTKGWEYSDSKAIEGTERANITWSFNQDRYNQKAGAWFNLYTNKERPLEISYQMSNESSFTYLKKTLKPNGFRLVDTKIGDNKVLKLYSTKSYWLVLETRRQKKETSYSDEYTNVFYVRLTKRGSVFDTENGNKKEYYDSGELKAEYTLRFGEIIGKGKVYYKNGKLKSVKRIENGRLTGKYIEYYDNGDVYEEAEYKDGMKHGIVLHFKNGDTSSVLNYNFDILTGKTIYYHYDTNNVRIRMNIVFFNEDGIREGLSKGYNYKDGKLSFVDSLRYVDGKRNGEYFYSFEDKIIQYTCENDLKEGKYFYKNQDTVITAFYKANILNGKYELKIKNIVTKQGEYTQGIRDKSWLYTEGDSVFLETYNKDVLNGQYRLTVKGVVVKQGEYVNGKKNKMWTYTSGDSVITETYVNDVLKGKYALIVKGHKQTEGNYYSDKRNGKWVEYFLDKIITSHYQAGVLEGMKNISPISFPTKVSEKIIYKHDEVIKIVKYDSVTFLPVFQCNFSNDGITLITFGKEGKNLCDYKSVKDDKSSLVDFKSIEYAITRKQLVKEGEFSEYKYPNILITIGKYSYGLKDGEWIVYDYDQKVKLKLMYNKGVVETQNEKYFSLNGKVFTGEYQLKDRNGKTVETREVKAGLRHGKTIYYDIITSKKIRKEMYKEGTLKK